MPVSQEQIEAFQRDGAIRLRRAFDSTWVDRVTAGIERSLGIPSPNAESLRLGEEDGRFYNDYCNWQRVPEFRAFVYESPAGEIAARLMGSRAVVFYHEHVLIKEAGAEKESPWHHDQPYYPVDGSQACSIWLPVDPVPEENSLRFVRGSHAWGVCFFPRKFRDGRNYTPRDPAVAEAGFQTVPDIDGDPERYEILSWELEPGDCVVFHMLTLHGARGNRSPSIARRALATRWLGDDARFVERPWETSPPITGGLKPGDRMACTAFPVVWPRA